MRKKKKERYIENKLRASENMAKKPLEIKRYNRKHEERKERKNSKRKAKVTTNMKITKNTILNLKAIKLTLLMTIAIIMGEEILTGKITNEKTSLKKNINRTMK